MVGAQKGVGGQRYIIGMRTISTPMAARLLGVLLVAAGCRGTSGSGAPVAIPWPVLSAEDGTPVSAAEFTARLRAADAVLLGELHDNPDHHRARAALFAAAGPDAMAVFEHFARADAPVPTPAASESREAWLDRAGFDRAGWAWPLHAPLVEAALAAGRPMRGTNLSREALRDVVRRGAGAAPPPLAALVAAAPLDSAARATLDAELVAGHCGQLPASMIAGLRDAQVVRDAAMAAAIVDARAAGTPWLFAGNGHVRRDVAVPRLLAASHPRWRVLTVGFVERDSAGRPPAPATTRGRYDLVVVTDAPAGRPDPCAAFRRPSSR